jgi:hypothetical protein
MLTIAGMASAAAPPVGSRYRWFIAESAEEVMLYLEMAVVTEETAVFTVRMKADLVDVGFPAEAIDCTCPFPLAPAVSAEAEGMVALPVDLTASECLVQLRAKLTDSESNVAILPAQLSLLYDPRTDRVHAIVMSNKCVLRAFEAGAPIEVNDDDDDDDEDEA